MKILLFTPDFPPGLGGIATHAGGIARGFSQLGEEIVVLTQHVKNDFDFDRKQEFKIVRVRNWPFLREFLFFFYLPYLVKKYRIERVYNVVWMPCGAISFFFSRILGFPYYIAAHGSELFDANTLLKAKTKQSLKWLMKLTFRNATKCFPGSNYTKGILIRNKICSENLEIIPYGVDLERFHPAINCSEIMRKYNLFNKKIILTVARLDGYKGHDMVIKSLPEALKKIPNLIYLIVGGGSEKQRLKKLIRDIGLQDRVIFTGYVPYKDIPKYYMLCDVFVMPSREVRIRRHWFEGFGIVYLEANACGKPVIGGRSGGVEDAVIHGQTGLLVDPNSIKEISEALCLLLTDERYANRLGQNGKRRIERGFTWQKIARRFKAAMEQINRAKS